MKCPVAGRFRPVSKRRWWASSRSTVADYTDTNGVEWDFEMSGVNAHAHISAASPKTYTGKESTELDTVNVTGAQVIITLTKKVDDFAEENKGAVEDTGKPANKPKPKPEPEKGSGLPWYAWLALGYAGYRLIKQRTGGRNYRG